ncbi:hypothetical protein [Hyphomicrobium sp.]|uniref:hypothetical protein n=1 Tax=Hyphomicrobium sp. TaxID=82 RepID=UPI002E365DEA|nr:hypothetical protein [Hyphomicrobium sp.]HEX2840411.1 hypothetical protein [Hyphomicrobium sp.]
MNTKLIAIASAFVATATLASAAEAGGGVRLGFGFPLGSFTATPAQGGGGGGSYRATRPKRAAVVQHATRKPDKPAHVVRVQPAKGASPKTEKTESVTNGTADSTAEAADTKASVTGSTALIQHSIPAQDTDNKTTAVTAAEAKAETKPADTSSTATSAADASKHCKKFIPAIGMTVSVGCDE